MLARVTHCGAIQQYVIFDWLQYSGTAEMQIVISLRRQHNFEYKFYKIPPHFPQGNALSSNCVHMYTYEHIYAYGVIRLCLELHARAAKTCDACCSCWRKQRARVLFSSVGAHCVRGPCGKSAKWRKGYTLLKHKSSSGERIEWVLFECFEC